jgi:predicted DNA-binding protein
MRQDKETHYRTEMRIPNKLADRVKALVGYHGHRSVNSVLNKALEDYCKKMEKK